MDEEDYASLLGMRSALRAFLQEGDEACKAAGISAATYELLLVVRARQTFSGPSVGAVAQSLSLRPSTVVGMVNVAASRDLIRRVPDRWDHRVVRLELTQAGRDVLEPLAEWHLARWPELSTAPGGAPSPSTREPRAEERETA